MNQAGSRPPLRMLGDECCAAEMAPLLHSIAQSALAIGRCLLRPGEGLCPTAQAVNLGDCL